jgi:manganese efflux pump family protein
MTAFVQIMIISVSLAMDAFSVSIAGGIKSQRAKILHAIKVAAFFGVFQASMPFLGWFLGELMKDFIAAFSHWIAFILLSIIGIKMIREALDQDENEKKNLLDTKTLIFLSIATSIDAFIVGISLNLLTLPFFVSVMTIGVVTFILSFVGFLFGKKIGTLFGKNVEIFGGVMLLLIGCNILLTHLLF